MWQDEFEIKAELTQGDFEALELAMFEMPNVARMKSLDLAIVRGSWFKAAIAAGWIAKPECAVLDSKKGATVYQFDGVDVAKMHPAKVNWYGQQVIDRHDAIMSADLKNL